ncbi:hypothetical protein D3C87_161580 [compost metagenome]|uniref:hypothetical protein n=1 Tax=Pedobacter sp. ok626 TaxID=1761882 RepID=UPI000884B4E3|nr:hypothetical protein [Pedobacter sp. ok626]SDL14800.1 hypothetical protein SAMN04487898_115120 [Pedobacter sp. ok626]
MKWKYRTYKLWVINTKTEANLYLWDKWKALLPSLDALINLTSEPAFIRSFQSYEFENRWLGFGRMKWNEESNIKWTTKYINVKTRDKIPDFSHTEIWAPDWNRVCDEDMPPDIFVKLYNFPRLEEIKEGIIIAMPKSLYNKNKGLVELELTKLTNEIPGATISTSTRSWWPGWKIRNQIGDINPQEIEKIIEG